MKTKLMHILALGATLVPLTLFAAQEIGPFGAGSQVSVNTTTTRPNVILKEITYYGSDPLAVGDPLRNMPVSAKHDAGPPLTQRLSYDINCQTDACKRAEARWHSPTTWEQDRAMGLSVGGLGK